MWLTGLEIWSNVLNHRLEDVGGQKFKFQQEPYGRKETEQTDQYRPLIKTSKFNTSPPEESNRRLSGDKAPQPATRSGGFQRFAADGNEWRPTARIN